MKRINFFTVAIAALLVGIGGCSKDEESNGNEGTKSLFVQIAKNPAAKSITSGNLADQTVVNFSTGSLYFVNGPGEIIQYYTISAAVTDIATGGNNVNLTDIEGGVIFTNMPGSITAVHVVGNHPGAPIVALPTTGIISAAQNIVLDLPSQAGFNDGSLYGTNTLTLVTPGGSTGNDTFTADVPANPVVARIEITDITGQGVITGFDIVGVYIDNYYLNSTVRGVINTGAAGNYQSNGTTISNFAGGSPQYPVGMDTIVYDEGTWSASGTPLAASPGTGAIWSYNLFAGPKTTPATSTIVVPRIIVKVNNITTSDTSVYTAPQFLTVRNLLDTSGTPIPVFEAGNVYTISAGGFVFDQTNLTPNPNQNEMDVTVTVTLATWTAVPVTAGL